MKKSKTIALAILLMSLFLLSSCGKEKNPVILHAFRMFHTDMNSGDTALYIDWENNSQNSTIDSILISVSLNSDSEQVVFLQLQEPEGVEPQAHNSRKVIVLNQDVWECQEFETLDILFHQVNYTDGTTWKNENPQIEMSTEMDGQRGDGSFPVKLNQALFYEKSQNPVPGLDPLPFQIDWTNLSETDSIMGVVYQITAKTADGNIIPDNKGNEVTYVSRFSSDSEQWIQPFADNIIFNESISALTAAQAFRKGDATIFEVSICRVIDSNGIIWEISKDENVIESVLLGKKGYSFCDEFQNTSVQDLIDRIQNEALSCGLNLEQPAVSIKNGCYCLLRYNDFDIRAELSEHNEVLTEKVVFIYYNEMQYDEWIESVLTQNIDVHVTILLDCISRSVLTDVPSSELWQKLDHYLNTGGADAAFGQIEVDGHDYDVYHDVFQIFNEYSDSLIAEVFGVGENLYFPPNELFWIRKSPWPSQNIY